MSACIADIRLRRLAVQIRTLGPRPLFLFEFDAGANPQDALERYAALDGDQLARPRLIVGGRR
jgi:hypothetical protein